MTDDAHVRPFDLEERSFLFAKQVFLFVRTEPKSVVTIEIGRQLVRAAGSVGANYIEANESLGEKDQLMHLRIARKEAKESAYWLRLWEGHVASDRERLLLVGEASELRRILSAIIVRMEQRKTKS